MRYRLKELRKQKKLTQKELADAIDVSKRTILGWENEERQIKSNKAQALADYFGVSVGYLLGYEGGKSKADKFKSGDKVNLRGTIARVSDDLILFQTDAGYAVWLDREAVEKSSERRSK